MNSKRHDCVLVGSRKKQVYKFSLNIYATKETATKKYPRTHKWPMAVSRGRLSTIIPKICNKILSGPKKTQHKFDGSNFKI